MHGVGGIRPLGAWLICLFTSGIFLVIRGEALARVETQMWSSHSGGVGLGRRSPQMAVLGHSLGTLLARGSNSGSMTAF